jgi:D-alanyl-D-alanine carboxypeptidase
MRRLIPLASAALALTLMLPAAAADAELTTEPMSAEDITAIDAAIEANPDVPAMSIGVWDPERGYYTQAYGLADVANVVPASVDDHFRIGSISKTFMAAAAARATVARLHEHGVYQGARGGWRRVGPAGHR